MVKVKDVMILDVKVIEADTNLLKAAQEMKKNKFGCLVVVRKSEAIGIVTSSDILYNAVAEEKNLKKTKVEDTMKDELITIDPEADLQQAAETMTDYGVKKLPVVDDGGALVGIITATDLIAHSPDFANVLINLKIPDTKQLLGS